MSAVLTRSGHNVVSSRYRIESLSMTELSILLGGLVELMFNAGGDVPKDLQSAARCMHEELTDQFKAEYRRLVR